jgi:DNA-binding Lrp family transcriptional regulator
MSGAAVNPGGSRISRLPALRAYVLIQTEAGSALHVAGAITGIDGVTSATAVNGPYDVIALAEAANVDDLGEMVIAKIQTIEGITRTLTCPVLRSFCSPAL